MSEPIDEIAAALAQAKATLEEINSFMAGVNEEYQSVLAEKTAAREAYEKTLEVINAKERAAAEKKQQALNNAYNIQQHMSQLELKIQQQKAAEEAAAAAAKAAEEAAIAEAERIAANALLTERFDKITAGAKWREWAKDHQIQAGHKITEDRYVILADPMGLGKTLSTIITIEMAERATKDASKDTPFLGIEKEVWVPAHYVWSDKTIPANYLTDLNFHTSPAPGSPIPSFMHYNIKQRLINEDYIVKVPGKTETQIVNSIERPVGRRVLYLCPASLVRNVMREFRDWAPHRNVSYLSGMSKNERKFFFDFIMPQQDNFILICNFEAWRKDMSLIDQFIQTDFDTVIIDEAHNAKDPKSIVYRGIKQIIDTKMPEYVIPMTGTPILNRPQELWALLTFVAPQEFYELNDFLYSFCEQDEETGQWKFQPGGLERIAKRISKHFMRRTKDQAGIKLPEKTIIHHDLEVDVDSYPDQARVRKQMKEFATIMIDESKGKAISAAAMIAVFTRLRQVETWPAGIIVNKGMPNEMQVDVTESQKLDYLIRLNPDTKEWDGLIPETIEDERIVVFSQFKAPLRELQNRIHLAGFKAAVLDGEVSAQEKDIIHRDFDLRYTPDRDNSKWDVVLCNYKVGGVGLNLTAATQLIVLDEEWNPGKRDQAYDRIHRIGQTKPVTIHVVRNQKTIDDWLAGIMEAKEQVVDGFIGQMVSMEDFKDALDSGLI